MTFESNRTSRAKPLLDRPLSIIQLLITDSDLESFMSRKRIENIRLKAWIIALLGWALPGSGHLLQGLISRATLMAGAVLVTYITGLLLGGHLYSIFGGNAGLLSYAFGFCNLGSGLLYVLCWIAGIGVVEHAQLPTAEYGNVLLMVAGLLNYLLMMDAFDTALRRKQ
jgi:hypothetical protein